MTQAKLKIKKGDKVVVLTGKDKGKTGEVLSVITETMRVLVAGVNIATKHTKPSQTTPGGIQKTEARFQTRNG